MRGLLTFASALVIGFTTAAGAVTYTDRTTFLNAITLSFTEDFETLPAPLNPPFTLGTGLTVSSDANDLYTASPGQSSNPTQAIGSNFPLSDWLDFDLGGTFTAFGTDIFQNLGGGAQGSAPVAYSLHAYAGTSLVASVMGDIAPNSGGFLGLTAAGFDRVRLIGEPVDVYEVADNVSVGFSDNVIPAPIPLPAGFPLLIAGVAMLGLLTRKRA
ncbi:hypothetical protein [Profundibacterium mesophilum]|uniref:VPLPA-CTERM sorting domain-containing protein n=1 Tax=Profundibacterium mesophilum KAUST100406-0324 TaxID=1037889 RepID=A0A921NSZ0_9RHOB|nr:hypothetical protein [Profundibacterium mesophilum]KAF0677450.1 hypothetical protein PMES_00237 [Profundibacterium mesophilum KAUST100406-0324]